MVEFAWIIEHYRQPFLGEGGISERYIISSEEMRGLQKLIIDSDLWLIIRSNQDRCIGRIKIKHVEIFLEGYYEGDFLVYCDRENSFRISKKYEEAEKFRIDNLVSLEPGVNRLNESLNPIVTVQLNTTIQIKLQRPEKRFFNRIKVPRPSAFGIGLAKIALGQVVENYSVNQLWLQGTGDKLYPFAYFSTTLIADYWDIQLTQEMLMYLKENDPLKKLISVIPPTKETSKEKSEVQGNVDIDFIELNPDTIFARKHVRRKNHYDIEATLEKTQIAEEIHQAMLRDIVIYLRTHSIIAFDSTSIDLMFYQDGVTRIFEIKSTTQSNIISQASKGAFQLAFYCNALKKSYESIHTGLILHTIDNNDLLELVIDALNKLNIRTFIYNPAVNWPSRISGFIK